MKAKDVQDLKHGLYRIHWKEKHGGGTSLAAVGSMWSGHRWCAPINWVEHGPGTPGGYGRKFWRTVLRVEVVEVER